MFQDLDPIMHQPLRLKIMSLLISVKSASFNYLLDETEATKGNLSRQIAKLKDARYIEVHKSFQNNYPLTTCNITQQGVDAFEQYVKAISGYLHRGNNDEK